MTAGARLSDRAFKRALRASAAGHAVLFAIIILNPSLPGKPSPRGVIHYLSMGMVGGGGGGRPAEGGVKAEPGTTALKPETLRDLTLPEKVAPKDTAELHYPVDEKTKRKPAPAKKATISKPAPESGMVLRN